MRPFLGLEGTPGAGTEFLVRTMGYLHSTFPAVSHFSSNVSGQALRKLCSHLGLRGTQEQRPPPDVRVQSDACGHVPDTPAAYCPTDPGQAFGASVSPSVNWE